MVVVVVVVVVVAGLAEPGAAAMHLLLAWGQLARQPRAPPRRQATTWRC